MRKTKRKITDELRPEYKHSDFGELVRGKYAAKVAASSNIVVLEPQVARAFPNDRAVNKALRSILKSANNPTPHSGSTGRKRAAA